MANVQDVRDSLYDESPLKNETSKFMLAESAALARAEVYRMLKKRSMPVDKGGGLTAEEEARLPGLYSSVLRMLKALGNLEISDDDDMPTFDYE